MRENMTEKLHYCLLLPTQIIKKNTDIHYTSIIDTNKIKIMEFLEQLLGKFISQKIYSNRVSTSKCYRYRMLSKQAFIRQSMGIPLILTFNMIPKL